MLSVPRVAGASSMSRLAGVLAVASFAAAALGFGASFRSGPDASRGAKVKFKTETQGGPYPQDRTFFSYDFFSNRGEAGGFAVLPLNPELRGDFDVQSTASVPDPVGRPLFPGFLCMEVDVVGSEPLQFFANCAQVSPSGTLVFAARAGNSNLGSHLFPGTQQVDLRIDVVGGTLEFQARPAGTVSWTSIATTTAPAADAPLQPFLGAASMAHGGEGIMDNFIVFDDGIPVQVTPEGTARVALQRAQHAAERAYQALENHDRNTAQTFFEAAIAQMDLALSQKDGLPQNVSVTKGLHLVESAREVAMKAIAKLEDGKPNTVGQNGSKALVKSLDKAWKQLMITLTE